MNATTVRRIAVAAQLAAVAGLAAAWAYLGAVSWPVALLAGIATVLAMFALSIALAFGISLGAGPWGSRHELPPVPEALQRERDATRLSPTRALACYLRECVAVFRMFNWLQPFRAGRRYEPAREGNGPTGNRHPPLLLVHGYGCNHAVWLDLQPALAAAGYHCEPIDLNPMLADIDDYSDALLERLRAMTTAHGRAPVMVCHSMGGLAARAALHNARRQGADNLCAGLITIGTPHHGCTMALIGSGANARQMQPGNRWLRTLAASEGPRERAAMTSIFSWHDSIAGPPASSVLPGARHIALSGLGHVSLLRDRRAVQALLSALAKFG